MSSEPSSNGIKIPDHSMPSDYSDVHPKSYDPEFISQISSQMQVPERIAMSPGADNPSHALPNMPGDRGGKGYPYNGMTVPDRILVAVDEKMNSARKSPTIRLKTPDFHLGKHEDSESSYSCDDCSLASISEKTKTKLMKARNSHLVKRRLDSEISRDDRSKNIKSDNQHIGVKSDLALHLRPQEPVSSEALSYVGLITPPRTLTMEESFPVVEEEQKAETEASQEHQVVVKTSNGHVVPPSPYDPGVNPHDSLLLNEEDEVTLLRTQMSKLARRVHVIEEEHKKRAQREFVLYPFIFGYVLWKVLGWFARDSR